MGEHDSEVIDELGRPSADVGRRAFLAAAGATGLVAAVGGSLPGQAPVGAEVGPARSPARRPASLPDGLFSLGVASGDPRPDRVLLWTRLAPDPLAGGGMPDRRVPVHWEVAEDDRFRHVVRRGTVVTGPQVGHSVHVMARGLRPGRQYAYRFRAGGEISGVGRTRTVPARAGATPALRFVSASCQNYEQAYYGAWEHAVADDPVVIVFLGDYIYEGSPNRNAVRTHEGTGEPVDVAGYRNRYAQYRLDPALQAAHAHCPWIVALDDHEVDNNWAGLIPQDPANQSPEEFAARRAAAFQVWWEHQPVAIRPPTAQGMRTFRRLRWGDLAAFHVLDTRQYRSDQVGDEAAASEPGRTMTGEAQERWLFRGLERSRARWQLIAQQTMLAQNDRFPGAPRLFDWDNWDGYRWQRDRLTAHLSHIRNPVVLTGDRHATWICDLKTDFDDPASPVVGAELTGTSIASGGVPDINGFQGFYGLIKAESPHWKFIDNQRGYLLHDVDRRLMRTQERVVTGTSSPTGTTVTTLASFVTEDSHPGVTLE